MTASAPPKTPLLEPKTQRASAGQAKPRRPAWARQRPHRSTRLVWAVGAAMGAVALSVCALVASPSQSPRPSADHVAAAAKVQRDLKVRQEDILQAQRQAQEAHLWDPLTPSMASQPHAVQTSPKAPAKARAARPHVPAASDPEPDSAAAYYRAYGTPEHFAQLNTRPSGPSERTNTTAQNSRQDRGVVLQARLKTAAASEPAGAPVIAVLRRPSRLGSTTWPPGTEVHGIVRGGSGAGARVFADFTFLRLPSGETCDISGHAQDEQGRQGVPGKRHLTGATAQSVGLASVGRAAGIAGRELAGSVGRVLGAGVEGAVDSGSDKARRVDRDETVVVAERNAAFSIYVDAAHCN